MSHAVPNPGLSAAHETPATPAIDLNKELTAGFAHRFIRFKVKQIIGRLGLKQADREDIEQDLRVLILRRFSQFDPAKSDWPAFVTTIIERRIATILEYQERCKRASAGGEVSLSKWALDADGQIVSLADTLSADHLARRTGSCQGTATDRIDLQTDCAKVLDGLSPECREICEGLKSVSIRTLARRMKVGHATVHRRLKEIRASFKNQGISEIS